MSVDGKQDPAYGAGLTLGRRLDPHLALLATVNWHLVAWIRQESSRIRYLWRLTDSEVSSLFSELAYPCNKVSDSVIHDHGTHRDRVKGDVDGRSLSQISGVDGSSGMVVDASLRTGATP